MTKARLECAGLSLPNSSDSDAQTTLAACGKTIIFHLLATWKNCSDSLHTGDEDGHVSKPNAIENSHREKWNVDMDGGITRHCNLRHYIYIYI